MATQRVSLRVYYDDQGNSFLFDTVTQKWYGKAPYSGSNIAPGPVVGERWINDPESLTGTMSSSPIPGGGAPGSYKDSNPNMNWSGGSIGPDGYDVQPGMEWEMFVQGQALTKYLSDQENELSKYLADLSSRTQSDIHALDRAAEAAIAEADRALRDRLAANQITHEKYMQERDLKQQESQFARDLALRTLMADRQEEHDTVRDELAKLAEIRQERALHAELASNPANFVAYEFYKRQGEQGLDEWYNAQGEANEGWRSLTGENYAPIPGAASDEQLQSIAGGITNQGGGRPALYNPNLGGVGAFGAAIPSPNEMSRSGYNSLDPTERAILESFIQAGVEMGPEGQRVAINPDDWARQMERSFIPVGSEQSSLVHYS